MLKVILYSALAGLALGALDNMADRTAAGLIGITLTGLALAVIVKAAR